MQETMPDARRQGKPRTAWMDNIKTGTRFLVEESIKMTDNTKIMEKVRPFCSQPWDRGRLKTTALGVLRYCDTSSVCTRSWHLRRL